MQEKIFNFLSASPSTIITTIIVLGLLIVFLSFIFKDVIIKFLKKKYDLLDTKEVTDFIQKSNLIQRRIVNDQLIDNKLFTYLLARKNRNKNKKIK